MKKRAILIPALLLAAALTPARAAQLDLYAEYADAVHVNVFRPQAGQAAESGPQVSMYFGKLDVLVDPNEWGYPEEGGCVDMFQNGVFDFGCGELTVEADGVMGTTRVQGIIASEATPYDSETGFGEPVPSQIVVDLVVTGTGLIEYSPYSNYAVGGCGFGGSEIEGISGWAAPELRREATMTGTLESQAAGAIDPTTLPSLLVKASKVEAGACL